MLYYVKDVPMEIIPAKDIPSKYEVTIQVGVRQPIAHRHGETLSGIALVILSIYHSKIVTNITSNILRCGISCWGPLRLLSRQVAAAAELKKNVCLLYLGSSPLMAVSRV
jgi:hypothetical protein